MPEQPMGYVPKDAVLVEDFVIEHMTGFVTAEDSTVRLLIHPRCEFVDVLRLVAHETGHKIEGGFKKNPPHKNRYKKLHEDKADHYENFTVDAYEISVKVFNAIGRTLKSC
jgi:hypothetical protein